MLAGIAFPDHPSLSGPNDGDVACHAAADALLSAAGLGDLGSTFDRREERWARASGTTLLAEAAQRVRAAGFEVGNVALQIIGSRPKITSERARAQDLLARAVGAPVAIAATTTDGLGFIGQGEGLGAIATALIRRAEAS